MSRLDELLKETISKDASFRFKANGGSMAPFIKDGDVLIISPLSRSRVSLGRIAAFLHPGNGKLAVHRIVGEHKGSFFIKGDAIPDIDGLVRRSDILGCVTRIGRNGENIRLGLGPERVAITLLSRGGLLPAIFWLWRLIPYSIRQILKHWAVVSCRNC